MQHHCERSGTDRYHTYSFTLTSNGEANNDMWAYGMERAAPTFLTGLELFLVIRTNVQASIRDFIRRGTVTTCSHSMLFLACDDRGRGPVKCYGYVYYKLLGGQKGNGMPALTKTWVWHTSPVTPHTQTDMLHMPSRHKYTLYTPLSPIHADAW